MSTGTTSGTLTLDQEATIYVSTLPAGQTVPRKSPAGRRACLFVIASTLTLNRPSLKAGGQARFSDEHGVTIPLQEGAELIPLNIS